MSTYHGRVQVWGLLLRTSSLEAFQITASSSTVDHVQTSYVIQHQRQPAPASGLAQMKKLKFLHVQASDRPSECSLLLYSYANLTVLGEQETSGIYKCAINDENGI